MKQIQNEGRKEIMNKKIVAMLMCAATVTSMMSGYVVNAAEEQEIVEIFWQYPAASEVTEGFYRMEDALNEMMEKDIGVHVTFIPTDLMTSQQDATLMVSSGEQLDVALTAFTSVANLVESGLVLPLDDYMEEHGADILELCGTSVDGCCYDGQLYGVPSCANKTYATFGYNMKKSYCDKYGFEYNPDKIYTMEELEEMFAIVKEGEGENFYMTVPWNNTYDPLNYCLQEYDRLTGSFSAGVLMLNRSFEDLTVYNFFETEEYKEYCEMMYDWAQKGYIAADAAVETDYASLPSNDNYLGCFAHGEASSDMLETNASWGEEVLLFRTVDGYFRSNGGCNVMWNVPITSANPEKAIEAINYVIKNTAAGELIQYGFEGEEYEVVEEKDGNKLIKFLAEDITQLPYSNVYGLWGNRLEMASTSSLDYGDRARAYQDSIPEERKSPALGYTFKSEPVSSEIAAIETVLAQYCYSFNAGALNPEEALPEFIEALKDAGIDEVIAENQRQIDEWAANK